MRYLNGVLELLRDGAGLVVDPELPEPGHAEQLVGVEDPALLGVDGTRPLGAVHVLGARELVALRALVVPVLVVDAVHEVVLKELEKEGK